MTRVGIDSLHRRPTSVDASAHVRDDVRDRVSSALLERAAMIASDAVALIGHGRDEALERDHALRVGGSLIQLLAAAVGGWPVDPGGLLIANLRTALLERAITLEQVFAFAYRIERAALDELALDAAIGAPSEAWPLVAQLVRRGSFDYLASLARRGFCEAAEADVTDALTSLHTRRVFDAVLLKETQRAGRLGYALALVVFDVDGLAALNERHGYGVGNRILERLGILMRRYFRQHDWVARYSDDAIAVLLTADDAEHAGDLADGARLMVSQRLAFTDRSGALVPITVSAGVVTVPATRAAAIDPERLLIAAEHALAGAKHGGRNRVDAVVHVPAIRALRRNSPSV
jgi:diguanylate cyclase (GGDEF)-like protein